MNNTQTTTAAMPIVAFLAGLLAGKGVFGLDAATWTMVLGSIAGLGATLWAAFVTKKSSLVTTVANMPEVSSVHLDPAVSTTPALSAATPANVKTP